MNPMLILAVVIAFVVNGFYWNAHGHNAENVAWTARIEKERADASEKARSTEKMWQGVVNGTVEEMQKRQTNIRRNLDIALDSLRDRPERAASVSDAPRVACAGGTGAELSRPDGEFLEREAARADEIRAGLVACYEVIDGVR